MAVEEDGDGRVEVAQKGESGRELIDDKSVRLQVAKFARECDLEDEVDVSEDGAKDSKAGEDGHGDEPIASNTNIEGS